ncbi:MAG: HD domain-containing protein [Spirochaetaceae bacterium]|jgi:HD superfamily phosphohydrolase|nr:HD domain-containing protein [Spirochaetaceae bacterium]
MQSNSRLNSIEDAYRILDEKILPELLPFKLHQLYQEKVIHDNLMESCYFEGWEIALLDTPLLQRLRYIHQLGTAFLTYPSAIHTRFSHTLGVTSLAGALYENLKGKQYLKRIGNEELWRNERATVRLAGLLHDIGHTFFSHCSELVVEPIWKKIRIDSGILNVNPKPHEFVAYLIITSQYFKKYWQEVIKPEAYEISIKLEDVASIIVGKLISEDKAYLTDIINGHYDVDKLEYLNRDAKTAGLPITYDKARYFQKIDIFEEGGKASLVMGQGGIQCVEQLALGKIMLYPYVYQHHKVLATDRIIQDIVKELLDGKCILENMTISHPLDMLLFIDNDILAYSAKPEDEGLKLLLGHIKSRSLPKRAFVFHREYLVEEEANIELMQENTKNFLETFGNPNNINKLREELAERISSKMGKKLSYHEILVTHPGSFNIMSMNSAPVLTKSNTCISVDTFWLLSGWSEVHTNKTDYVYFHVPGDICVKAYEIIASYLKDKYSFQFQDKRIREHCKLNAEDT